MFSKYWWHCAERKKKIAHDAKEKLNLFFFLLMRPVNYFIKLFELRRRKREWFDHIVIAAAIVLFAYSPNTNEPFNL